MIPSEILRAAREEVEAEQRRAAIEVEKARLRAQAQRKPIWRRVVDALPFTITRKSK